MLFNSVEFLFLFLPITLAGFLWLNRAKDGRSAVAFLVVASLFFYGWWDWRYVALIVSSMLWNWWLGNKLSTSPSRQVLAVGIAANLLVLGYYKYANFFVDVTAQLSGLDFAMAKVVLPIGISFYTFTQIAFLVDAHRGIVREKGLLDYALFIMFFPQLIAGPILHHKEMMPQFAALQGRQPEASVVAGGLFLLFLGLFKKMVIADNLAAYVDPAFANVSVLHIMDAWTAALGYTLQLYFDFSAYSEMAMGLSMLFGITLPLNFNSPYKATNIADFWKRWHMTLSRFLRDYVYIPLGGNRNGFATMLLALWATMFLGGLWHGAGWTFIVWGMMHGSLLVLHRLWQRAGMSMPAWPGRLLTFAFVVMAWVMFRANTVGDAVHMWETMLGLNGIVLPPQYAKLGLPAATAVSPTINGVEIWAMVILIVFCMTQKNVHEVWNDWSRNPGIRHAAAVTMVAMFSFFSLNRVSSYLYWQF